MMAKRISEEDIKEAVEAAEKYFAALHNADMVRTAGEVASLTGPGKTVMEKALERLVESGTLVCKVHEAGEHFGVLSDVYGSRLGVRYYMRPETWDKRVAKNIARQQAVREKPFRDAAKKFILDKYADEYDALFRELMEKGL